MIAKPSKRSRKSKTSVAAEARPPVAPWIAERFHKHLHIAVYLVSFFLCGFLALKFGQDNNWDLRNYHYYNPFAFLTGRIGFDFAPAQLQSYLNPLLDIPHYLGITYLPPKVYSFLLGGIQGLNIGITFAISFLLFRKLSPNLRLGLALLCTALGFYSPVFLGEIGATQNDILISLFVLVSLYLFFKAITDYNSLAVPAARNKVILASVIFGISVGLKMTMLIYGIGIAVALLFIESNWLDRTRVIVIWGLAVFAGLLISNGFWMIQMYHHFENPTFPYFNQIFLSPWADPIGYSDDRYLAKTFMQGILRPFEITYDCDYTRSQNMIRDGRYAVLYALTILLVVIWFAKKYLFDSEGKTKQKTEGNKQAPFARTELFLIVLFGVSYVFWQHKFSILRYASVYEQIAPALIVILLFKLTRNDLLRTGLIAASTVFIIACVNPVDHDRARWSGEEFWNVQLPKIENPDNAIILMANTRPWGYFVPLFPHEIRWVRVVSNFTDPTKPTKMQSEIRRVLDEHDGNLYLLSRDHPQYYNWLNHDVQMLAAYGLAVDRDNRMPIVSQYSRPGLSLWPVLKQR